MKMSMLLRVGEEKALLGHSRQGYLHYTHNGLVGQLSPVGITTSRVVPDAAPPADESDKRARLVMSDEGYVQLVWA